jgi:adenine-specific DNA-methyltransferase
MMNSGQFAKLLERYSPHVAGGQFDLSPRYVDQVPVPNLAELALDERAGRQIARLAALGREPRLGDADWLTVADRITTDLYGGDFFDQV